MSLFSRTAFLFNCLPDTIGSCSVKFDASMTPTVATAIDCR
jgi:hypothetical protein